MKTVFMNVEDVCLYNAESDKLLMLLRDKLPSTSSIYIYIYGRIGRYMSE